MITAFVFLDAIKLKSRLFVIIVGSIYTFLNFSHIYDYVFTDYAEGVVLFNYTINGEEHTIMKRSTKRSIFLQVLLFSITAIYTMFKDKKMELMIFATGNIYRETGTASKEIEDKTFSSEIKQEKTSSMDQSNQQSNNRENEILPSIDEPIMNISEQYDERVQNPLHKYKY